MGANIRAKERVSERYAIFQEQANVRSVQGSISSTCLRAAFMRTDPKSYLTVFFALLVYSHIKVRQCETVFIRYYVLRGIPDVQNSGCTEFRMREIYRKKTGVPETRNYA